MYADRTTGSMRRCLEETARRRQVQEEYNREHGITPETVRKSLRSLLDDIAERDYVDVTAVAEKQAGYRSPKELRAEIEALKAEMFREAEQLNFEKAATLRDRMLELEKWELEMRAAEGGTG